MLSLLHRFATACWFASRDEVLPTELERRRVETWLQRLDGPGPLVVLHARGGRGAATWPDEHWLELGDRLQGALGAQLVFTGVARDAAALAALAMALPGARILAGRLAAGETLVLLQHAALVVAADPAIARRAAAAGAACLEPGALQGDAIFQAAERLLRPHLGHLEIHTARAR